MTTLRSGFLLLLLFGSLGCMQDKAAEGSAGRPLFDMEVQTIEQLGSHQQLLLRLQLLHYGGDLLRFGLRTVSEHQERLRYYTQDFRQDVRLVSGGDTLACVDSHFERLYMDAPYRDFVLTFPGRAPVDPTYLILYDRQFTGELLQLKLPEKNE